MAQDKICVKISTGDHEDLYFKEMEQKQIKALREKSAQEENRKYQEAHKNHCFRCGTKSLAEVCYGDVKIDVCINEDCGAVHLDPGELEAVTKNRARLDKVRKAVFSIFQ